MSVNLLWCQEGTFYCVPQEEKVHFFSYTFSCTIIKNIKNPLCDYIIMTRSLLNWKTTQATEKYYLWFLWSDHVALWNSYLFFISNNVWAIFSTGDHQITFVTLNRFCLLSKPRCVVNHLLFLTDKIKLDGTPSKIKWKIHVFWYTVF